MEYIQVAAGLTVLVLAGDAMVRGAVSAAVKLDIPAVVIGATVIAVGTSAPELVVGIDSVLGGYPTLALGNVVGSNVANILLAVGLPAMVIPVICSAPGVLRTNVVMLLATGVFLLAGVAGSFSWPTGTLFLALLVGYILDSIRSAKSAPTAAAENSDEIADAAQLGTLATAVFLLGGLVGVIFGADWLVDGAVVIARNVGVSEAIIGLTLVALGTSLPELATGLIAAFRGHGDVAVGNVIGSNVFNLLGIVGACALVGKIPIPEVFWRFDLWVMAGASLAMLPFCLAGKPIGRVSGAVFVIGYCSYIWIVTQDVF
ncbi:MAG: calcium/sodium antiporter [Pseudomonadota bacterium]